MSSQQRDPPSGDLLLNNEILPVGTYSYLCVLVPVFLLTDWLRYKPVVVRQGVNLVITTAFLLWLRSAAAMQAMECFYCVVTATEVAYFSYIYRSGDSMGGSPLAERI